MRDRIQESFPEDGKDAASSYLDRLYEVWKDIVNAMRRAVLLLITSMLAFELLNRSAVEEFSLGPLKISDLKLIETAIPVLVAYLLYDLIILIIRWSETEEVYTRLTVKFDKPLTDNDFDLLIHPPTPSFFGATRFGSTWGSSIGTKLRKATTMVIALSVLVLPLVFQAYAYYQLYNHGEPGAVFWISAALSSLMTILSYMIYILWALEPW